MKKIKQEKIHSIRSPQLDALYRLYDHANEVIAEAMRDKNDAERQIKALFGDIEEASTPDYLVTYKHHIETERRLIITRILP